MARQWFIPDCGQIMEEGTEEFFVPDCGQIAEDQAAAGGPKGPLGMPLHGPLAGPIGP